MESRDGCDESGPAEVIVRVTKVICGDAVRFAERLCLSGDGSFELLARPRRTYPQSLTAAPTLFS